MSQPSASCHNSPEYSVSEISGALKRVVEDTFGYVRVRAEVSGLKVAASGHAYLTLKDDKSVLDGVCWKGTMSRLRVKPEDGLEVICTGKLTTYPGRSKYQLVIEALEPAGIGALLAQLEERKKKLAAEGLFDEARKKRLPFMPHTIGVITSPTGAVIRDILHRISGRFPCHVLVWPVLVQGEGAAAQVAKAIEGFQGPGIEALISNPQFSHPDVIIIARGGGSLEDLWAFNEEIVVRAVAQSRIPIISAVGHETDTTLIDYVADMRAPTPTAAAEMAVPVREEWSHTTQQRGLQLQRLMQQCLQQRTQNVEHVARGLLHPTRLLDNASQRLDEWVERLAVALPNRLSQQCDALVALSARLHPRGLLNQIVSDINHTHSHHVQLSRAISHRISRNTEHLSSAARMLESLSHTNVLARGFALVKSANGELLTSAHATTQSAPVSLTFHDGEIALPASAGKAATKSARKKKKQIDSEDQASLF